MISENQEMELLNRFYDKFRRRYSAKLWKNLQLY